MSNITLAMDETLLIQGREMARKSNMSFNAFVRSVVAEAVSDTSATWLEGFFDTADSLKANSHGAQWAREDLYVR